jgi:hypothetical protein
MTLPLIPLGLLGRSVPPSFPILRSFNNDNPGTFLTSHNIALPAGIQAGDLVVVAYFARSTDDMGSMPTPSGWDSLAFLNHSPGAFDTALIRIISKVATGPMSTVTVTTPGASSGVCSNSYAFSLWTDIAASAFATGESSGPNSPNLAPSGWGASPRVTWLSFMITRASTESVSAAPSGFTGHITSTSGGTPFARISSSRRDEQVASLNPGAWTMTGSVPWGAATVAIRGT